MNRKLTAILAVSALFSVLTLAPINASAATPEEAAEAARSLGFSEDMIQQAWNAYNDNPELYTPEFIDYQIEQMRKMRENMVTNVPHDPDAVVPSLTTPVQVVTDDITLTMPDGSTFTRISRERFIALSYEEKQLYLSTFTEEQQSVFIADLSPEEYRSLMKQLPSDKKADLIDDMSDIADTLDLTLSVDTMTDDDLVISIKNDDGELVGINTVHENVAATGYDRRGIFAAAGALITAGAAGLFILVKKCLGGKEQA